MLKQLEALPKLEECLEARHKLEEYQEVRHKLEGCLEVHLNLEDLNVQAEKTYEKQFKPIIIDDREILVSNTRKLDFFQR